jgi:tripartite tricarboxylate transporter TctB family protein
VLARAVPLVLLVAAGVYLTLALRLPFGAAARPGAGFYPVIVAVFAIVVALAATASAFRGAGHAEADAVALDAAARRRVVISVVALAAFCLALPWVGYPAAAFAFVAVVLRCLGSRWTTALLMGVLSAAASYGLFAELLDVPLPRGPW